MSGSLFTPRRKCGTHSYHRTDGPPHESLALAYSAGGRVKTVTSTEVDVTDIAAALPGYPTTKADLGARTDAGLVECHGVA